MQIGQIAVSPCSNPEMGLDEVLDAYARLGYRNFEVFTSWTKSAFDYHGDPQLYRARGERFGMRFVSMHLPPIVAARRDETLREAVAAARFAEAIGVPIVLYKASDRPTYIAAAPAFLDAIQGLHVVPVIQNHYGTPLTTLVDVKEVHEGIGDSRMRALLEVGHFHSAGVHWRDAAAYLGPAIALVHIKDQAGRQSVPFGKGEIDLPGLFQYLDGAGYAGHYVIEMEVADKEHTIEYLAQARDSVLKCCTEGA